MSTGSSRGGFWIWACAGLCNLMHRGAIDADGKTGDGAGILTQIPRELLNPVAESMAGKPLHKNDLAVGVFFLPLNDRSGTSPRKALD